MREPAERSSESPSAAGGSGVPAQPPTAGPARPARLESLTLGASVTGVDPRGPVRVIQAQWHGADCLDLTYRDATGRTDSRLLYRDDEPHLEIVAPGPRWSFDGDGNLFKLAAEAQRIRLAYLFDPGQIQQLVARNALAHDAMDASRLQSNREEMERAEARRLQPHYIESFFLEAFRHLGGTIRQREPRRYEVTHVPATVRNRHYRTKS